MITYYLENRQNPISKSELKKKVGDEWTQIEQQTKALNMVRNYSATLQTKQGTVIAENNTLICWSQFLALLTAIAAILLTIINHSFAMPQVLKTILFYTGMVEVFMPGIMVMLGLKTNDRHIIDIGMPLIWAGLISMDASVFW